VAANGALTGFSAPGGLVTKRRMPELEGATASSRSALFGREGPDQEVGGHEVATPRQVRS
jgi:hypothetical protein